MQSDRELREQLRNIDHKSYPQYKSLKGSYRFPKYILHIDHVQGDPFACDHRCNKGRISRFCHER